MDKIQKINQIVKHFTDNDLYTFTCMYYILQRYPRAEVEYKFFDRNKTKYPKGFAELLREQMNGMAEVVITNEEIEFMKRRCSFLPLWFIDTFLRGYRFNPSELIIEQDEEGYLDVRAVGKWYSAIMWEMPVLSTISELSHILNGDVERYNLAEETEKALKKAKMVLSRDGFKLADMGTRRRFSFNHQDMVLSAFDKVKRSDNTFIKTGTFIGTSNVYFAMKYDMIPIGTMSHQIISFEENVSGVNECNFNVMNKWSEVYDGNNGIFLYDCFGDNVFFNNLSKRMAMLYSGLRVDSGSEVEQTEKIISKYNQLGINPSTKQIVFSNGLNLEQAFSIHDYVDGRMQDSYGIGTQITCDVTDVKPMNIVFKLVKCRLTEFRKWSECIKLSCDKGKTLGDENKCKYIQSVINP